MGHSLWGRKELDTTEPLTLSGLAALTAVWVRGSQGSGRVLHHVFRETAQALESAVWQAELSSP